MLRKGSMLHGMESLAGLKLRPEQGRAQTNGAVSHSPANNPFAQVGGVMLSMGHLSRSALSVITAA